MSNSFLRGTTLIYLIDTDVQLPSKNVTSQGAGEGGHGAQVTSYTTHNKVGGLNGKSDAAKAATQGNLLG